MNGQERTILFLIADTGAGHRSAANAIRNAISMIAQQEQEHWLALQQTSAESGESPDAQVSASVTPSSLPSLSPLPPPPPTYRVVIVDAFEEYSRFPLREAMKLYGPAIRYNPRLYGQVFHLSNQSQTVSAVQSVATPLIQNGLLRLIRSVQPDVIVSVHPLLNHVTLRALQELEVRIPFITVVTDLVSVHYAWFAPGADAYIVPTEHARQLYLERRLDPKRVHMLGMPIDPKFTLPTESKEALRQKLSLEKGLPAVLMVGGGEGSGGLRSAVQAISQARLPVQLLIVTGRNKRLYMHLQRIRSSLRVPAKIYGFVHNMPELMRASDVIITKAGPGTICEALACGLPVILNAYVPGQEEGNVTFVTDNQVGTLAYDSLELINMLRRLIKPGSQVMQQQLENAKRIARPNASFDIAQCILSFLPPANQPGVWHGGTWHREKLPPHYRRFRAVRAVTSRRLSRVRLSRLARLQKRKTVDTLETLRYRLKRLSMMLRVPEDSQEVQE
ncbi:MAG TPA: glycosyltransferase [Ktedonobacteraceae bacterium]|nr:glycosyltransferase [Ktedonobacteraceae bacterium]